MMVLYDLGEIKYIKYNNDIKLNFRKMKGHLLATNIGGGHREELPKEQDNSSCHHWPHLEPSLQVYSWC